MNPESQNIEYKESWRDEYLKWICGFANAQGGKIYLGVNDKCEVIGLSNSEKLLEDIPNKVRDLLGVLIDVNLLCEDEKYYLELIVESNNVPISYKGQYYYRTGSTMQELKGIALQEFILKKMGRQWDEITHEKATMDCIDSNAIKYFVKKGVEASRLTPESLGNSEKEVLENLHLIDENEKLTNAAILLFAKCPQKYFSGVQFKIGFFGKDDSDLIFQDVVEGNILQMADRVVELLKAKYLISPIHYEGMQRIEPLEIPEAALREIIYNAIIHKQYSGPAIQMRVYADHIELWNLGKLPVYLSIDMLMQKHSSYPRNCNIANVFYKAGFIEAWGRGFNKIKNEFEKNNLPIPEFMEHCGGIMAIIKRTKMTNFVANVTDDVTDNVTDKVDLSVNQVKILKLMLEDGNISLVQLSLALSLTKRTIQRNVNLLQEMNFVVRVGNNKTGKWCLTEKAKNKIQKL